MGRGWPQALSRIRPEELVPEGGCEVTWTRAGKELFVGAAGNGGSCRTTPRRATHVISYSGLTSGSLVSLDQGFDDAGAHRWGPPPVSAAMCFASGPKLPGERSIFSCTSRHSPSIRATTLELIWGPS